MKIRTLLRDESLQLKLEKNGAVVSPFLVPANIPWILERYQHFQASHLAADTPLLLQEQLSEKLQSKVEYRCINCSPFQIYFSELSDYICQPFHLQPSITDESKFSSLHLIAPLLNKADASVEFRYLAGAHLLPVVPRGKNIPKYFENQNDFVVRNFSLLKIKSGEAVLFFGNIPYSFAPVSEGINSTLLEILILPYEARQIIYEGEMGGTQTFLQPYETELVPFIEYQTDNKNAVNKMKPLRKIPFEPSLITDKEKEQLLPKPSLQKLILKATGLSKIFPV